MSARLNEKKRDLCMCQNYVKFRLKMLRKLPAGDISVFILHV
jgi:hypothetical protein